MSEPRAKPRWRRLRNYLLLAGCLLLVASGALIWYTTTDSFRAMVRRRLVSTLEHATGGRVELGSFHTVPLRFRVEVQDLTIHGKEAPGEVPYAHADRLIARASIRSVLGGELGFSSLIIEHPVIHIVVYPDGTTNQPTPKLSAASSKTPIEQIFSFSIGRFEVRRGEFIWNDTKTPFDFEANDVSANLTYSLLHQQYDGNLLLGKVNTRLENYRPIAWMAEAHFTLGHNGVEFKSLKATSGRSRVQASGQLVDFRTPTVTAKYDATVDLAEAAAVAHYPDIRQGILQATGDGTWSLKDFSSAGKLQLKNLDWRDKLTGLRVATLIGDYLVNSQRLALSHIQARLLGGEVTGDAEVTDWRSLPTALAKGKAPPQEKGNVRLLLKGVSAFEVAVALSSSARPLSRMNLVGTTDGSIEAKWRGPMRNVEANIALDTTAPAHVTAAQLPLNAHVRATYRIVAGELDVAEFNASTRSTQVRAAGKLSSSASVKLFVTTTDMAEWQPVLAAVGYQERVPVVLHGHATFNGTATGKISDIVFAGKLQSEDFDIVIPATSHTPAKDLHCDSMVADVELSPHALGLHKVRLEHGDTLVTFDLSASLQERQFSEYSPFSAHVDIRNADVEELQALLGYDLPLSGMIDLTFDAGGTKAVPHGTGSVTLSDAVFRGEHIQHADAKVALNREEISFTDLHASYHDARLSGAAAYNYSTHAFRFNLDGRGFDLAAIPQLQVSRVKIEGQMDFEMQGSGTVGQPLINAKLSLRDLTFDHERAGDYTLEAVTHGDELHLTGHSQFKASNLDLDGNVQLHGDFPAAIDLHFAHLDIDSVLRTYLKERVTGHSAVAGDLQLRGPLGKPSQLEITGNLNELSADIENIKVHNSGAINFTVVKELFAIQQFHLIGEDTDLTLAGTIHLTGDQRLDVRSQGHAGLQLIQSLNPDFTTSGEVDVDLAIGGTVSRPTMQGRLQVTGGSIAYRDLPSALSAINGSLVFNQDRLQVETLTAHVGGGLVSFGGYATAYNRQLNFNLTLQAQDVRLRYPPGVSSAANGDLRWTGTSSSSVLSGDFTITKLAVTPGFDFGASLARAAQAPALPQTNPLLSAIRLDIHVVTTPELQMQTAVVRLSGDADMHLQGTAAKPVLLGRADVTEGEVYFNGTKYRLERGDVTFANPITTTPVLDLQASTHVRDYDITVNLNGSADKLNLTYHSEPPLPIADIINLLALGQTQQQSAQLQQVGGASSAQQASSAILAEALSSAISNRSRSLFGISHIKIDPQGLNTETSPTRSTPAVTIEQQVKDNLTLTYTTNVSQTSQQIIQAQYNVTRNVSILALRDYNGVISFEVRIRQRKK